MYTYWIFIIKRVRPWGRDCLRIERWTCVASGLLRAALSLVERKFSALSSPHILLMTVILSLPSVRPQQLDS